MESAEDAIDLELAVDVGILLLDVGRAVDVGGSHDGQHFLIQRPFAGFRF